MEINTKNQTLAIDSYVSQIQAKQKIEPVEGRPPRGPEASGDTVHISDAAKRVREAQNKLQEIPDVRSDKVAEIKRQIEGGSYEIKAGAIAGKMIRESLLNDLFK
jgi:negative regulator of flagellin synthesis FlgM